MKYNKVLILTYYWPPSGGGGVQRWMYFAIYLSKMGIKPKVITVDPQKASYPLIDNSQINMVENIETIYTNTFEPLKLYSLLKSGSKNKEIPYGSLGGSKGIFSKIMAFVRANFFIPDARKGWTKYAINASTKILNKEKFDWIITTGPPHSTHLAGYYLSKKFKIKWLADFRDPWSEIYFLNETYRFNFAKQRDLKLEKKVLNNADIITTVGPSMAKLLLKKINNSEKLKVLYNGYDHELLQSIENNKHKNIKFTITHLGLLGSTQRFDSFINALLCSKIDMSDIQICLAGKVDTKFLNSLNENKINVTHHNFLERKTALTQMKNSELLLLCPPMTGNTELIISTKTMEYLACSVPILGIGDTNSDASKLVAQQSFSGFFNPDNINQIADFLYLKYSNFKKNNIEDNNFDATEYSRYNVSKELLKILNS